MADVNWKKWALIGGGVAAVAGVAGAIFVAREKAVEQPDYKILRVDHPIEIRAYPELLVAEATDDAGRDAALSSGFSTLAGYIFAKSRDGGKIAMTAPVLQDAARGGWRTRFVMPARYTADTLPDAPPGVTIATVPARHVGAIRFSGSADDAVLQEKTAILRAWLARHGFAEAGPAEYGFYNSPFMPAPIRRNEVLIPIAH